ncbi:leucine rich repeat protein [Mucor ambiguus]|uniref:Leucine rich repeat protein n=1 Tax=Mucor ambiguus TaxID=91626 RepID=A0A0C9M970_9FUNG|nr:leucine rich repeat protein [Mucor ambiguus]
MNGIVATFYESENQDQKKILVDTISFTSKAYLAFRKISSLRIAPPAVPYLGNLSSLLLQNNNLKTIPSELWRLVNLQELNLGCNQLEILPKEIGLLKNLQELFLHSNQLVNIPSQIGYLHQLQVLDLTDNRLESLPGELVSRLQLKNLWVEKNPFCAKPTNSFSMITLKHICAQTIGLWCLADPDSRDVVLDLPDSILDKSLIVPDNISLVPLCQSCQGRLFHYSLSLVIENYSIPFVYNACSQNCFIRLHNNAVCAINES